MSDVSSFLEHHGVKGQKWGVRKSKVKTAAKYGAGLGAAALIGVILGRKGHISVSAAQSFANDRTAKAIRDVGHNFVKDSIDKKVLFNYARQISEGLINA